MLLGRLARQRVFQSLPPEECAKITELFHVVEEAEGTTICREGGPADALFIIDSGIVRVTRDGKHVAQLEAGDMFGEMEMVTDTPRIATIEAVTPVTLFELHRGDFDKLVQASTAARQKIQELFAERSHDLAERDLVPETEAATWRERATDLIATNASTPTAADVRDTAQVQGAAVLGIWLGIMLDGIPESLVIGTSVESLTHLSWALIAGVFLANLPEAMSSSVLMRDQGLTKTRIIGMWTSITVITGVGALLGNIFLRTMTPQSFAVIEGAAAGAMLTMIAQTMLPEAYENGGPVIGICTLFGFLAALFVKSLA